MLYINILCFLLGALLATLLLLLLYYRQNHHSVIENQEKAAAISVAEQAEQGDSTPAEPTAEQDSSAPAIVADELPQSDMLGGAVERYCVQEEHYKDANLTVGDLAKAIHSNRTYLSQWFASNHGSFYAYINRVRIEHAAELLKNEGMSIKEVYEGSGYTNAVSFRKYFQEIYGCLPNEYRQRRKE